MKIYNSQFADEFYTMEQAVELTVTIEDHKEQFRIEAIEGPEGLFSTRSYIKRAFRLSPAEPANAPLEAVELWVPSDLPATHRDRADDAIDQALSFLNDRVRGA